MQWDSRQSMAVCHVDKEQLLTFSFTTLNPVLAKALVLYRYIL